MIPMPHRPLGRTGLAVSVIGLGSWQFGGEWGVDFTQPQVDAILDTAAECGINLLDTAECYGPDHLAERFIGDFLSRRQRDRWLIATKFGHRFNHFLDRTDDFTVQGIGEQLDASLRALRVERIDLYQFHSGSDECFQNQEMWSFLERQKRAGKIGHLGVSIWQKGSERQAELAAQFGVEALQVFYNRLDRRPEELYFPAARRDGLGVLARVPLASGLLSGKYRPGSTFTGQDVRAKFDPEKLQRDLAEVERIRQTEVPANVPMAAWAMAWCLRDPLVTCVIPGSKSPEQVRANAAAAQWVTA